MPSRCWWTACSSWEISSRCRLTIKQKCRWRPEWGSDDCDAAGRVWGSGPVLHLAHANGFPPGTYRPLAEALADRYRVIALPARPLWSDQRPESSPTWRPLADDLVRGMDELGLAGVVGVGHSLGGVLTLWAANRRPDLFRCVVLIDPVIFPQPTCAWSARSVVWA